ncbi:unnamed protein product [Paramecium primaurelia]|uniref:Uncharacterized protein n=1 Tax=Paramecium primaurelia TaxID=5886 RepID=A0A8S1KXG4_PARPR|nr:unnamed protein product [Paramecium primaurelia]
MQVKARVAAAPLLFAISLYELKLTFDSYNNDANYISQKLIVINLIAPEQTKSLDILVHFYLTFKIPPPIIEPKSSSL